MSDNIIIKKTGDRKATIAFMIRSLEGVGFQLWKGMCLASKKYNFNLITFYGGKLGSNDSGIIYEFINKKIVDGIVSWAISDLDDKTAAFFSKLGNIPIISCTLPILGYTCVDIDNFSGMKEVVNHLIKDHNKKKIGLVRGPEKHIYSIQRFGAFKEALEDNNIKLNENLITPSLPFSKQSGLNAYNILFNERKLKPGRDIDALVCVSDQIAVGMLEEFKKNNIKVPEHLAMTGFNNSDEGICSHPSITSVSIPIEQQADGSAKLCLDLINGIEIPESMSLEAKPVFMQSCGCQYASIAVAKLNKTKQNLEMNIFQNLRKNIKDNLNKSKSQSPEYEHFNSMRDNLKPVMIDYLTKIVNNALGIQLIEKLINDFLNSFFKELLSNGYDYHFINTLEEILYTLSENNVPVDICHSIVSILRHEILPYLTGGKIQITALDLLDHARILIGEIIKKMHMNTNLVLDDRLELLRSMGIQIAIAYSNKELSKIIKEFLPKFDIKAYYMCLYENSFEYKFLGKTPEYSRLVLSYSEKNSSLNDLEIRFKTEDVLPKEILEKISDFNFMLIPLYYESMQLGFLIIDRGPIDKNLYALLKDQISSKLNMISLMDELTDTKKKLEITIDSLKNKAGVISNNSEQISASVNDISAAMEETAAGIKEISKNINEVTVIVGNAVELGKKVSGIILNLDEHSKKIGSVTDIISDIAQRTNILSLNASIQAARAGESGKGFTVVAKEIKDLSIETVKSTNEINEIIKQIQKASNFTIVNISNLIQIIQDISKLSDVITGAITQQSATINNISNLLVESAHGTKEIAKAISEVAISEDY